MKDYCCNFDIKALKNEYEYDIRVVNLQQDTY